MRPHPAESRFAALPKAELHLHLEGSIEPDTVVELAARHGTALTREEAVARYAYGDFTEFLEAFRWVTSFLRTPEDYALITAHLVDRLQQQNVVYAEVTLSVGVMFRRAQDVEANFGAIRAAGEGARAGSPRLQWIFDAARQFGTEAAMEVARCAARMKSAGAVAFGMGGDELALPATEFRRVYDFVASENLHRLIHAGEIGGPESVREAVELLGVERIGHGISVMRDPRAMDFLAEQQVPLEVCPTSNLRTGALARQLGRSDAHLEDHPLLRFLGRGISLTLASDDPAMFHTSLLDEYGLALRMGLSPTALVRVAETGFQSAFLPPQEKRSLLERFRAKTNALGLI